MTPFRYKLKTLGGQISKGVIATDSSLEARTILSTKGFTLISLTPLKTWQRFFQKVELQPAALLHFFKVLAQLCRAGLPLPDALKALEGEGAKQSYQPIVRLLEQGFAFSNALKKSTLLNNELLLSFLEQAECSGDYPHAFDKIVTHLEWREALKKRLKKTLSYPLFVFTLSIALLIFLMTFVVPQLLDLYNMSSLEIPPMTQALLTFSNYASPVLVGGVSILTLAILMSVALICYGRHDISLRNRYLTSLLKIPLLGVYLRDILLLQYTANVHGLLEAQKDNIIGAMSCAEQNLHPSFFGTLFEQPRLYVEKGSPFSSGLHGCFPLPETVLKMLQVGEKSGALPTALKHVTGYIQKNLQDSLDQFIQRLGPLMLLLVGGFLLFIIAAIFLPLYGGLGALEGL